MTTLYQKDNQGKLRQWSIWSNGNTIIVEHGLVQGAKQQVKEVIIAGLGGRTIDQQIESRINSRINKQIDKGYRYTIQEANEFAHANALNLYKPMLAQQFDKQKKVNTDGAVLQRKLDGNRMLVTKQNGNITCYTRNGKPIETLDHIIDQMDWLDEGQTVDGEVYNHGMALKDINSRMRRKQAATKELNYHIYDIVDDKPFKQRFKIDLGNLITNSNIIIEPFWRIEDIQIDTLFTMVRKEGYEGLMMRLDDQGYQAGKRSKGLLKIKHRYDAEYLVIDIEVGKNGAGILVMQLPNGQTVKGVAPGTFEQKLHVAAHPEQYVGLLCTCSFAYLTEYGIPFHLTCDRWRD